MYHHHHHHDHGHGRRDHSHASERASQKAYAVGIALNLTFVIVEVIYGLLSNSLALLADAGHNAGDVLGLAMAWGAACLARSKPSDRYTYGLQSSSILASLANAILLLVVSGGLGLEAIQRLTSPPEVAAPTIMAVALVGIMINGATALLFMRGREKDLNRRAAFLHMASDAAISAGVVISGFIIMKTGLLWLDPAISLLISIIIVMGTARLLRDSFRLALHATPETIDTRKVKTYLASRTEVREVHDLHIWAMSTTETALSAHLVMERGHPGDRFLEALAHDLIHEFGIGHSTVQIEIGDAGGSCKLGSHT